MAFASSIPGPEFESGHRALLDLTASTANAELRAAVAFVTSSGVDLVERLLAERNELRLALVARGAPVTEPAALVRLAELGVEVSAVVGEQARRFHPKLWLLSSDHGLDVLSGSGNLTVGGMLDNTEQFEHLHFAAADQEGIDRQHARFERLREGALPLADLRQTPYWSRWEAQVDARAELAARQRELDGELGAIGGAELNKERLYTDLREIYEKTKEEVWIPDKKNGGLKPYNATRFKQRIDIGRAEGTIFPKVYELVTKETEGFGHLAEAAREDLMVETLVLDKTKKYHRHFSENTKAGARANLDRYHQWLAGGRVGPVSG